MGFFSFKKAEPRKKTFEDISLDELRREKIEWGQKLNKLERDEAKAAAADKQLRNEYACAESDAQKRSIARKLRENDFERKGIASKITHCTKSDRIVSNFIQIKENIEFYRTTGVSQLINSMDPVDVEQFIGDATIDGQLNQEKLAAMLTASTDGANQLFDTNGDSDLDAYMAQLDKETAPLRAERSINNAEQTIDQLEAKADAGIESVDKTLNPPQ